MADGFDFEAMAKNVVGVYVADGHDHPLLSLLHVLGDEAALTVPEREAIIRGAAAAAAAWDARSAAAKREYAKVKRLLAGMRQRGGKVAA